MRLQNTSARPKEKFKLEFERRGVNVQNVEDDNDLFFHPPNVRLTCVGPYNFYRLRRSIGRGKLPKILESKN